MDRESKQGLKTPKGFRCDGCSKPKRCCDFTPFVPNFLVGEILNSGPFELIFQLEQGRLTPLGLVPGQEHSLCSFFDDRSKQCQVWSMRPSECASYYCVERLGDGAFYKAQSQWLFELEMSMAQMAMVDLGFSDVEVAQQLENWNRWVHEGVYCHAQWPEWSIDPKDFYRRCSEWFQNLDFLNFRSLLSEGLREDFDKYIETT